MTLLLSLAAGAAGNGSASAAAKKYANCTALNKDYKGGVARSASVKNKGGKTKYKPFVSQALYDANVKSDRDKDGIACREVGASHSVPACRSGSGHSAGRARIYALIRPVVSSAAAPHD